MDIKKKKKVPVTAIGTGIYIPYSNVGSMLGTVMTTTNGNGNLPSPHSIHSYALTPTFTVPVAIKDLRSSIFTVAIGHYDIPLITTLIRCVEFKDEKVVISFALDEKDMIREAFSEYHFFRLSYLNTKGEPEEIYEIKTDPTLEMKYILPDVGHDNSNILIWKLVWSPYTVTKVTKGDKDA